MVTLGKTHHPNTGTIYVGSYFSLTLIFCRTVLYGILQFDTLAQMIQKTEERVNEPNI